MYESINSGKGKVTIRTIKLRNTITINSSIFNGKINNEISWVDGDIALHRRSEGKMIEIGRVCIKIAGRDASKKCVIIDILDDKFVLIDGETRRRKCNILHLEPLKDAIKIKKNASHEDIKEEFEKLGLKTRETKPKPKTDRPRKRRKTSEQLRAQKEEKKKLRGILGLGKRKEEKKKAEKKEGESLEEKAGLIEENGANKKKEAKKNQEKPLKKAPDKTSEPNKK